MQERIMLILRPLHILVYAALFWKSQLEFKTPGEQKLDTKLVLIIHRRSDPYDNTARR